MVMNVVASVRSGYQDMTPITNVYLFATTFMFY